MFARDADINGFPEKQPPKSRKSAQNAKVHIGMCREGTINMEFLKKHWWKILLLIPLGILVLVSGISQIVPDKPPKDFLITKNFLDLAQISSITKYRGCSGHQTISQYTDEPPSRMDHDITRIQTIEPDQLKIYAPFDGYVTNVMSQGISMVPGSSKLSWWPFNQWRFSMPHTHPLPEYDKPTSFVKAGTLIGYADYEGRYELKGFKNRGTQVIIGITAIPPMWKNGNTEPWKKLESIFYYMSDEVFAEYQAAIPGLKSRDDFIISKEYRQAHPCKFKGSGPYFDALPEDHTVYLGLDINTRDRNEIYRRSITGPDGILEVGDTCEAINDRFRLDNKTLFVCAKQNNKMIWIYDECPDSTDYRGGLPSMVVKNGVRREVGKDEMDWIAENCEF